MPGRKSLGNQACNKRKSIHMKGVVYEFGKAFTCRESRNSPASVLLRSAFGFGLACSGSFFFINMYLVISAGIT